MPVALSWQQIALRLGCTLIAGMVVGLNRDEWVAPRSSANSIFSLA